jgi:hypothetical protein
MPGHIGEQQVLVWQAGGHPRACQSTARDGFLCRAPAPSAPARAGLQLDLFAKKDDLARTMNGKLFVELCELKGLRTRQVENNKLSGQARTQVEGSADTQSGELSMG